MMLVIHVKMDSDRQENNHCEYMLSEKMVLKDRNQVITCYPDIKWHNNLAPKELFTCFKFNLII